MKTDCQLVDRWMDAGWEKVEMKTAEEIQGHLQECGRCRTLYGWIAAGPQGTAPSEHAHRRIVSRITNSLGPVRRLPPVWVFVSVLLLVSGASAAALLGFLGTAGLGHMTGFQLATMSVLLVLAICLLSLAVAWQMRPGGRQIWPAAAVPGVLGIVLFTALGFLFPWRMPPEFFEQGWPCLFSGLTMSVLVAGLLWLVIRRAAPVSPAGLGAALGATAGLTGFGVLQFECPHQEAPHLLLFHLAVWLVSTLAGVLAARAAQRA